MKQTTGQTSNKSKTSKAEEKTMTPDNTCKA